MAHDAIAEVLPPEDQSADEAGEPGETEAQLMQEIREEAEEEAAAAGAPVVLTFSGETALAPEVPAKGAGAVRGGWGRVGSVYRALPCRGLQMGWGGGRLPLLAPQSLHTWA